MGAREQRSPDAAGRPSPAHPVADQTGFRPPFIAILKRPTASPKGSIVPICAKPLKKSLFFKGIWCPEEDSNLHDLAIAST